MRRKGLVKAALAACFVIVATALPAHAVGGGVISLHCKFSHTNFDDPIVFPGQVGAAHQHGYVGSTTTNALSTVATMRASGSSCPVTEDTAGYWFPVLVKDGVVKTPVQVNIYYRSPSGATVEPWPMDFRIIAGGDTTNPPSPSMTQRSLSWSCFDSGPFSTTIPNCGDRAAIAHVHFPNCISGTDSADHRSHAVFGGKTCPAGYTAVPRLSMHIRYKVGDPTGWNLTSDAGAGTSAGRSLHADFWNTWDSDALAFLVDRCLNAGADCKGMTSTRLANMGFEGGGTPVPSPSPEPPPPSPSPSPEPTCSP